MKKYSLCLIALIIFLCQGSAFAENQTTLVRAGVDLTALESVQALYTYQEADDGTFTVSAENTDFLVRRAHGKEAQLEARKGIALLGMGALFDPSAAAAVPYVTLTYLNSSEGSMQMATIKTPGMQYDFPLYLISTDSISGLTQENYVIPLEEGGYEMIGDILNADSFQLRLYGEHIYCTTIEKAPTDQGMHAQLESGGYQGIAQIDQALKKINIGNYRLWERNLRIIDTRLPGYQGDAFTAAPIATLSTDEAAALPTLDMYGILAMGARGTQVRALEEQLIAKGFMNEVAGSTFDENTYTAVCLAQTYYRLPQTGCADAPLLLLLYGLREADIVQTSSQENESAALLGETQLTITDYWYGSKLYASHAAIDAQPRTTGDEDLCYLIMRGTILNNGTAVWDASRHITGNLVIDGQYRYHCTFEIEADGGRTLGMRLLPLGKATLLVYATVPKELLLRESVKTLELFDSNTAQGLTYYLGE